MTQSRLLCSSGSGGMRHAACIWSTEQGPSDGVHALMRQGRQGRAAASLAHLMATRSVAPSAL